MRARLWRATATPLASIIGSGFLVLAPILLHTFGRMAPAVMATMCVVAYLIGAAIRKNIHYMATAQPLSSSEHRLDRLSSWTLVIAYVVTVSYYLNLLGAFAVSLTPFNERLYAQITTTVVLVGIGVLGWTRGLRGLEWAEEFAVAVKLAVIGGLLVGLGYFAGHLPEFSTQPKGPMNGATIQVALGLLITVQGFETSRYLGAEYTPKERIQTMRLAQIISALIYVAYIGLVSISIPAAEIGRSETAIVEMTRIIAPVLPALLVLAALTAQFSAAVADTNGYGGLIHELSAGRLRERSKYLLLVVTGLLFTWGANVFEIISYASRCFALYYAVQCVLAALFLYRRGGSRLQSGGYLVLCLGCLAVVLFGVPAEGATSS